MIGFQTVKSFVLPSIPLFSSEDPRDDVITKVVKIAYRILNYIFGLIERGIEYLIRGAEPDPFYVRYKWSIRITLIALGIFGAYMGTRQVKIKVFQYLDSFMPGSLGKFPATAKQLMSNIEGSINNNQLVIAVKRLAEKVNISKAPEKNYLSEIFKSIWETLGISELIEFNPDNIVLFGSKIYDALSFGTKMAAGGIDSLLKVIEEIVFLPKKLTSKMYDFSYAILEKFDLGHTLDPLIQYVQAVKFLTLMYCLYRVPISYCTDFYNKSIEDDLQNTLREGSLLGVMQKKETEKSREKAKNNYNKL